ncbi:MAG: hypothetical protein A4S09_11635 [Proteobacteria bacterium SG_bin7]|nr:MAG: hypothetical protein A4S09_11635 [Proteobacteria bacterium SG_bin7]
MAEKILAVNDGTAQERQKMLFTSTVDTFIAAFVTHVQSRWKAKTVMTNIGSFPKPSPQKILIQIAKSF